MAASSFSIYLLHINPNGSFGIFRRIVNEIYAATDGVVCILEIGLILIGIALLAIIIDQIRILLWNCLQHIMNQACKKYDLIQRIWFYKSTI